MLYGWKKLEFIDGYINWILFLFVIRLISFLFYVFCLCSHVAFSLLNINKRKILLKSQCTYLLSNTGRYGESSGKINANEDRKNSFFART